MNIYNRLPYDIQRYIKASFCGLPHDFEYIDTNAMIRDIMNSIQILQLNRNGKWVRVIDNLEYTIVTSDTFDKLYSSFSIYGCKSVYIQANHTRVDYDESTFKTYIYFKILEQYERLLLNGEIVDSVPINKRGVDWDIVVNILNHIRSNKPLRLNEVNPVTYKNTKNPRVYCVFCNIYYKCKQTYKQHIKTTRHFCKKVYMSKLQPVLDERLFYVPSLYHIQINY